MSAGTHPFPKLELSPPQRSIRRPRPPPLDLVFTNRTPARPLLSQSRTQSSPSLRNPSSPPRLRSQVSLDALYPGDACAMGFRTAKESVDGDWTAKPLIVSPMVKTPGAHTRQSSASSLSDSSGNTSFMSAVQTPTSIMRANWARNEFRKVEVERPSTPGAIARSYLRQPILSRLNRPISSTTEDLREWTSTVSPSCEPYEHGVHRSRERRDSSSSAMAGSGIKPLGNGWAGGPQRSPRRSSFFLMRPRKTSTMPSRPDGPVGPYISGDLVGMSEPHLPSLTAERPAFQHHRASLAFGGDIEELHELAVGGAAETPVTSSTRYAVENQPHASTMQDYHLLALAAQGPFRTSATHPRHKKARYRPAIPGRLRSLASPIAKGLNASLTPSHSSIEQPARDGDHYVTGHETLRIRLKSVFNASKSMLPRVSTPGPFQSDTTALPKSLNRPERPVLRQRGDSAAPRLETAGVDYNDVVGNGQTHPGMRPRQSSWASTLNKLRPTPPRSWTKRLSKFAQPSLEEPSQNMPGTMSTVDLLFGETELARRMSNISLGVRVPTEELGLEDILDETRRQSFIDSLKLHGEVPHSTSASRRGSHQRAASEPMGSSAGSSSGHQHQRNVSEPIHPTCSTESTEESTQNPTHESPYPSFQSDTTESIMSPGTPDASTVLSHDTLSNFPHHPLLVGASAMWTSRSQESVDKYGDDEVVVAQAVRVPGKFAVAQLREMPAYPSRI